MRRLTRGNAETMRTLVTAVAAYAAKGGGEKVGHFDPNMLLLNS